MIAPDERFPPLLTTQQVSKMTSLTPEWFFRARKGGYGPPFMRVTSRIIRYDREEVMAFFARHKTTS